jgi:hypothetical protein
MGARLCAIDPLSSVASIETIDFGAQVLRAILRPIPFHRSLPQKLLILGLEFCYRAQFQRTLFLVLCCSSGLGACHHPSGWFHLDISPLLPHVFPSISVYIILPRLERIRPRIRILFRRIVNERHKMFDVKNI